MPHIVPRVAASYHCMSHWCHSLLNKTFLFLSHLMDVAKAYFYIEFINRLRENKVLLNMN